MKKRLLTAVLAAALMIGAAAPAGAIKTANVTKLDLPENSYFVYSGDERLVYTQYELSDAPEPELLGSCTVITTYDGQEIARIPGDHYYFGGYRSGYFVIYDGDAFSELYIDKDGNRYETQPESSLLEDMRDLSALLGDLYTSRYYLKSNSDGVYAILDLSTREVLSPYQFTEVLYPIYGDHIIALKKGSKAPAVYRPTGEKLHELPADVTENAYLEPMGGSYFLCIKSLDQPGRIYDAASNAYVRQDIDLDRYYCMYLTEELCTFNGGLYSTSDLSEIAPAGSYGYIEEFVNDVAVVTNEEGLMGLIDNTGRALIDCIYEADPELYDWDYISVSPDDSTIVMMKDDEYYLIQVQDVPEQAPVSDVTAKLNAQTVLVDGVPMAFDAYNIDNDTYFKLRDLACALRNNGSRFSVGYDAASNSIALGTGAAYEAAGGELETGKAAASAVARPSEQSVTIDGLAAQLEAYAIGGYNYFKLRDLGTALGFGVEWDGANIIIHSAK